MLHRRPQSITSREGIDIEGKPIFGETSIRSIPDARGNEIEDLRTGDDNLRAADFMLGELRKYTEDNGTELHVSIAGGRKTMSALLFSCMSLLGREQDKVYLVLLPPALEGGVTPTFYYPKRGTTKAWCSPLGTRLRSALLARIASPACAAVTQRNWATARGR